MVLGEWFTVLFGFGGRFQVGILMPSVSSTCGQLIGKDWRRPAHCAILLEAAFRTR